MKPSQHAALSIVSGGLVGVALGSWPAAVSCALIGFFIDLDHCLDFWLERGLRLDPREFFDFCYRGTSRKFYDLLHGWEFIPLLWLLTRVEAWSDVGWGLTVGYTLHLLGDQLFNRHLHRFTYFFLYRLRHRFDWSRIVLPGPLPPSAASPAPETAGASGRSPRIP